MSLDDYLHQVTLLREELAVVTADRNRIRDRVETLYGIDWAHGADAGFEAQRDQAGFRWHEAPARLVEPQREDETR
jgi:hypothetical protein